MWHLAWWPMRHSRVRAETGEAVGAAGGRQPLVKFLLWFKTTNTWPGRQPCPLQNNGCTCRGLLDARSEAVVLRLLLPTTQNVVCVNELLLPFPWCSGTCCSVPSIFLKLQQQLYWMLNEWFYVVVVPVSNRSFS